MTMELPQITDFRAEAAELRALLGTLTDSDWARETQFKGWTVNDILQHLHMGDILAITSARDPDSYDALVADIQARRATGLSRVAETRERLKNLSGAALRARWQETWGDLCATLAAMDSGARLKWSGPGMGLRMFATARQMETWAHGQAIYDIFGEDRPAPSPRLRNIAEIGVRTFAWAFRNRGMDVPASVPFIALQTPFGETWEWHGPAGENTVTGEALEFCQVVTQTRNVADTNLRISGTIARDWMAIAQCFAGPPETPPAPGTRFRM